MIIDVHATQIVQYNRLTEGYIKTTRKVQFSSERTWFISNTTLLELKFKGSGLPLCILSASVENGILRFCPLLSDMTACIHTVVGFDGVQVMVRGQSFQPMSLEGCSCIVCEIFTKHCLWWILCTRYLWDQFSEHHVILSYLLWGFLGLPSCRATPRVLSISGFLGILITPEYQSIPGFPG